MWKTLVTNILRSEQLLKAPWETNSGPIIKVLNISILLSWLLPMIHEKWRDKEWNRTF